MPEPVPTTEATTPHHVELVEEHPSPRPEGEPSPGLRSSNGWDGKLRVSKNALVANPEALSDPEYSDDENVLPDLPREQSVRRYETVMLTAGLKSRCATFSECI